MITDAIRRELRRGGQVYYLHNDVASIARTAARIQQSIPEARIGIGHGKMNEEELFRGLAAAAGSRDRRPGVYHYHRDRRGGAQRQYLDHRKRRPHGTFSAAPAARARRKKQPPGLRLVSPIRATRCSSEIAQKRLSPSGNSQNSVPDLKSQCGIWKLGSGGEHFWRRTARPYGNSRLRHVYQAAGRSSQSDEGRRAGNPIDEECLIDMQVQAHIPESYIDSTSLRLKFTAVLRKSEREEDAFDVTDELIDRFGEPPAAVKGLIDIALLRNTASRLGITEIKQVGRRPLIYKKKFDMRRSPI